MIKLFDNDAIFENVLRAREDLDKKYSWDSVAQRISDKLMGC